MNHALEGLMSPASPNPGSASRVTVPTPWSRLSGMTRMVSPSSCKESAYRTDTPLDRLRRAGLPHLKSDRGTDFRRSVLPVGCDLVTEAETISALLSLPTAKAGGFSEDSW